MLINLRNALMTGKRLPYDAEVEFLQTDGNAYIAAGITPPTDATVKTELTFGFASSSGRRFLFSDGKQNVTHYCEVNASAQYGAGNAYISQTLSADTMYSATATFTSELASYSIDINGTQYTSSTTSFLTSAWRELILFRLSATYRGSGQRIGAFKIYVNGTLVRDYIPVRKGTVGYLYDRVSKRLFGNAGSGDFTYGSDVLPVEYIESHGTEWIDTGAIPDDSTGIEVVHTICPDNEKDNIIFGARQDSGNTRYWSDIDWGPNDNVGWGFNTYSGSSERFALASSDVGRVITNSLNYMNDRAGKIDGVTYDSSLQSKTLATISRSIYLFGANNMGTIAIRGTFKVYSAKISKGQTLVNKFRPVRVGTDATSWEGAMMDVLTRRIYRNAGTGAFGYGNDLKYPIPA